jgi:hypothetical protein
MSDRIEALLAAHMEHELTSWREPALSRGLDAQVAIWFRWLTQVKLDDLATREQIMGVIDRYVIELNVSGGITELTGEMYRVLFTSKAGTDTRVDQLLPGALYDEFAEKVAALERVRRELIKVVAQSAAFRTISARLVARGVADLVFRRAPDENVIAGGVRDLLGKLSERLVPGLERRAAELLASYIDQHAERLAHDVEKHLLETLDPVHIRSVADEIWDNVSSMQLADAFAFVGETDIEDFVVLSRQVWLAYRKTTFFRRVASELVDFFFAKYGQESMASLIDDMGVTEGMVAHELKTLLVPIIAQADRSGLLEQQVRARLEAFYRSPLAAALIDAN